jgi:maltose/moltooligosaccharide transporter
MPFSPTLLAAASLLWVLDAANNITMEPYRAYVGDRLSEEQRPFGYLSQAAFTGLAQTLSYLMPSLLVWWGFGRDLVDANGIPVVTRIAFVIGAVLSISTILFSVLRVRELPLSRAETDAIRAVPMTPAQTFRDISAAIRDMPAPMRQLALAMLCQWYAMFCYWQYITFAIARSLFDTAQPSSPAFREAALISGQVGAFYNFIAFLSAFALVPFVRRLGAKPVHAVCLVASGVAMVTIPSVTSEAWLLLPMIGIGVGWASMMGNPYVMLADSIPPARTGIYMGIFNMFIVIPMLIQTVTMPLMYRSLLGGDPRNVLMLAGFLMIAGAAATMMVRVARPQAALA